MLPPWWRPGGEVLPTTGVAQLRQLRRRGCRVRAVTRQPAARKNTTPWRLTRTWIAS